MSATDQDWIRSDGKGGVRIGDADPIGAFEIDAFVALVYRVAGKPTPIILHSSPLLDDDATVMAYNGAHIVREGQWVDVPAVRLRGYQAQAFAAHVARLGEIAEAEPDPAEVETIAAALTDPDAHPGGDYTNNTAEELARTLVRRFRFTERAS